MSEEKFIIEHNDKTIEVSKEVHDVFSDILNEFISLKTLLIDVYNKLEQDKKNAH